MKTIESRWLKHKETPFPDGCVELDPAGVCLTSTDTFIAGCITTFLNLGTLDDDRIRVLKRCVVDLNKALPKTDGDIFEYFNELKSIAEQVINNTE